MLEISFSVNLASCIKTFECIIAINTDPKTTISDIAHYAVIGNVTKILPLIQKKLYETKLAIRR